MTNLEHKIRHVIKQLRETRHRAIQPMFCTIREAFMNKGTTHFKYHNNLYWVVPICFKVFNMGLAFHIKMFCR